MKHETPLPSPEPNPDAAATGEIKHGATQLAGNLVKIVEAGGAQAVKDYLTDVLADTEGKVAKPERQATFSLLAREQQEDIQAANANAGELMLADSDHDTSKAQRFLDDRGGPTKRFVSELRPGRRPREHDESVDGSNRVLRDISLHSESITEWQHRGKLTAETFIDIYNRGLKHKQALKEAEQTLDPQYDGEPRDLSGVIDEKVKVATAKKIQTAIEEAKTRQDNPESAVMMLISQDPTHFSQADLKFLVEFAGYYHNHTAQYGVRIRNGFDNAEQLVKRFKGRAQDAHYVKAEHEAEELHRQQRRTLAGVSQSVEAAIRTSGSSLQDSSAAIRITQQQLARTKSVEKS